MEISAAQQERIQRNREAALAKRLEKNRDNGSQGGLCLSPLPPSTSSNLTSNFKPQSFYHSPAPVAPPPVGLANNSRWPQPATSGVFAHRNANLSRSIGLFNSPRPVGVGLVQKQPHPSAVVVKGCCSLESRARFMVLVSYNKELIDLFKTMKTRVYNPETKNWSFDLSEYNSLMTKIQPMKPGVIVTPLSKVVLRIFNDQLRGKNCSTDLKKPPDANLDAVDQTLVTRLMPFQRQAINFAVANGGRCLLADEMGLGKTFQALGVAGYYRSDWPLLIVCPSTLRDTWAQTIGRLMPSVANLQVLYTGKDPINKKSEVIILSYELLTQLKSELKFCNFIIFDEAHQLKSSKAERTKAATPLCKSARRVLLLTGTPALSRPKELYSLINCINSKLFANLHEFGERYCDAKLEQWGWNYEGCSNMQELKLILDHNLMIRRVKENILTELPMKGRHTIVVDTGDLDLTDSLTDAEKFLNKSSLHGAEKRGALLSFFAETAVAKLDAVEKCIRDKLAVEDKIIVFAHHKAMLDHLNKELSRDFSLIRIDGNTPPSKRQTLVDSFQQVDSIRLALLSITAACTGITLTAAATVIFAELFWNPGVLIQAEDRVHRIGQLRDVNVYYLVASGTADDHIWPLLKHKLNVLGKVGLNKEDFSTAETRRSRDDDGFDSCDDHLQWVSLLPTDPWDDGMDWSAFIQDSEPDRKKPKFH